MKRMIDNKEFEKLKNDVDDSIKKSDTSGLVKNDGTIDTTNYASTSKLDKGVYYTTTSPTEESDTLYIYASNIENVNSNVLFNTNDLILYINNDKVESVYKITEIDSQQSVFVVELVGSVGGGSQLYQHFVSVNLYDTNTSSMKFQFAFKYTSSSNEEINTYDKFTALITDILGSNANRDITNGAIEVNGFVGDGAKRASYLVVGNNASAWTNNTIWLCYGNSTTIDYNNFPDPAITRWYYTFKDKVKAL